MKKIKRLNGKKQRNECELVLIEKRKRKLNQKKEISKIRPFPPLAAMATRSPALNSR
jgi:hypothetical protein